MRVCLAILTLIVLSAEMLRANIVFSVPDTELLPDAAGQTLWIYAINDGSEVSLLGLGLNIQIGDGGPSAGGVITGPEITNVDLFSPTFLFGSNNNGQGGSGSLLPQIYESATLTESGFVQLGVGTFVVGSITLNSTGFSLYGQTWDLDLHSLNGPSEVFGIDGNPLSVLFRPSVLTMVPEPSITTTAMTGSALLMLASLCREKSRKRSKIIDKTTKKLEVVKTNSSLGGSEQNRQNCSCRWVLI